LGVDEHNCSATLADCETNRDDGSQGKTREYRDVTKANNQMRQVSASKSIQKIVFTIVGSLIIGAAAAPALAQEKQLYDGIDCTQWKQNPNGTWDTGPKARFGDDMSMPDSKGVDVHGITISGVDVAALLEKKCGKK
jgi:hypothetical protein